MKFKLSLVFFAAILSSSCSQEKEMASINGKALDESEFNNFLTFKGQSNLTGKQKNAQLKEYVERKALVESIKQETLLDTQLLETELLEFEKQMYISRYFDEYLNKAVNDEAVQNFYVTNKEQFQANNAKISHILIRLRQGMGDEEVKAKLTQAHEIYSKLKTGEDFTLLAQQFSEDKNSAEKGGDLGWVKEGAISQVFSQKAFSLKLGEVSEPVRTAFGFHIIKLNEGPSLVTTPFEKVKGDIRYQLRNKAKEAELKRLMSKITIEIDNDE